MVYIMRKKQLKNLLLVLTDRGSILMFIDRMRSDVPLFVASDHMFEIRNYDDFEKECTCKFEPEQSWLALNKGKISKRSRRCL